ncbi:MAG: hypothetical protein PWQ96_539 [Clostridia bacterium]|jgi:hypothetical protein|nr:hypothetical protein [Clostridiales bacterium]MDK2984897.1 hypothetical protein [Clostridia bacterium]
MGGVKPNMRLKGEGLFVLAIFVIIVLCTLNFIGTSEAEAACGAKVSSCKSCHEVKKEFPVANSGKWHSDHAFGDFCEFCHGGVVKAKDKSQAHTGLVDPFSDIEGSCSSCHVTDLEERAATYGATLTSSGGSGSNGGPGGGSGSSTVEVAAPTIIPAEEVPEKDLIDYNRTLAMIRGEEEQANLSNVILILLNLAALSALIFFLWKYDIRSLFQSFKNVAALEATNDDLARLAALDLPDDQIKALGRLAEHPEGAKLLKKLATTDFEDVKKASSLPHEAMVLAGLVNKKEGEN